ncbi:helix-turn-helix domain-containing protein [Aquidulcibacter sp.]|uniref:helix-turn-helix domain-containing protein n=1 Tax=Aquidulcibacter sp. TaxID=2052990 RepID=UPI0037840C6D
MISKEKLYCREQVAKRLVEFRERVLGASQTAFAASINLPLRTWQSYEQCRADISAEVLVRLHDRLGADPLWLLLGIARDPRDRQGDVAWLVSEASKAVEVALQRRDLTLTPEKHGALVAMVYTRLRDELGDISKVDVEGMVGLAS